MDYPGNFLLSRNGGMEYPQMVSFNIQSASQKHASLNTPMAIFISIVVCVLSSLAYVIPVKIISMLIVLFLITFTGFNATQHIYWFFAFKKYAPGVIFSSIGLAVDLILTIAILVQGLVNPIIVAAFAIATVPMLVETFRAKNKSTKAFESMHEFTLKMVAFLEK